MKNIDHIDLPLVKLRVDENINEKNNMIEIY